MKVRGFTAVNIVRPSNDRIQPSVHLSNVFKNFGDAYKEMERLWNAEKKAFDETGSPYTSIQDGNTMRGLKYESRVGGTVLDMWVIKEISVEVENADDDRNTELVAKGFRPNSESELSALRQTIRLLIRRYESLGGIRQLL